MYRTQYEDRAIISTEMREKILAKSESRCCKCGHPLTLKKMTVDHYIPISKGGTNNMENLVPMCKKCNKNKNDLVITPGEGIKYIDAKHMNELQSLYKGYIDDVKWYRPNSLSREDMHIIQYPLLITAAKGHIQRDKYGLYTSLSGQCVLEKVTYDSLEEVYDYTVRYMNKYNLDTTNLKEDLSKNFSTGTVWKIRGSGGIIATIFMDIGSITVEDKNGVPHNTYVYKINGIPVLNQGPCQKEIIRSAFGYILGNLARLSNDKSITFILTIPAKDTFLEDIFNNYYLSSTKMDENWVSNICIAYFCSDAEYDLIDSKTLSTTSCLLQESKRIIRLFKITDSEKKKKFDYNELPKNNSRKAKDYSRTYRKGQKSPMAVRKSNQNYKRNKEDLRYNDYKEDYKEYIG